MIKVEVDPVRPASRSIVDIERDDIARQALETAAQRIEAQHGNRLYMLAWKVAAKIVRASKP